MNKIVFLLFLAACSTAEKETPHLFDSSKRLGPMEQVEVRKDKGSHTLSEDFLGQVEVEHDQNYSLPGMTSAENNKVLEETEFIPVEALPGFTDKDLVNPAVSFRKQAEQKLMETKNLPEELLIKERSTIIKGNLERGQSQFNLGYIKDDYDVKDSRGIFDQSFNEGPESKRTGMVMLGMKKFLYRGFVDFHLGGNFGFGFFQGLGYFESDQISDATFTVWTIPVDLAIGLQVPVSSFFKLELEGGPSAMGLLQTRSDKEPAERKKRRRQISPGYFATGRIKISLSRLFENVAFKFYRDYSMSNVLFHIEVRNQSYTSFQDSIEITGQSIGAGFSFEYF